MPAKRGREPRRDNSGNTGLGASHLQGRLATVVGVKTTRRAALGAIGACALVLSATACSSESNDAGGETLPDAAVEATTSPTEAPTTEDPTAETGDTSSTATDPSPTDPAVVVPEALQFTAPLVGGGTFDGAAAAGKPTVFWFWAPT